VIGKIGRGSDVAGLLRYLFGPGRANEHTRPHLVASWDGAHRTLEPPRQPGAANRRDVRHLAALLSQPVMVASRPPDKPVWHCSVRTAPADRRLSDTEWAAIARQAMTATGIAPAHDPDACRWVAVRHADDHIHIVATLVRQDGRTEAAANDFYRVGEACRWAEDTYHLTRTAPRDRTANRRPSRAEREKSTRTGRRDPARVTLRRQVRTAAASAASPDEFLRLLTEVGLQVRPRLSELDGATVTGYSVALPGDRDRNGRPIWFGGGKLASDLSWPRLAVRWPDSAGSVSGHVTGKVAGHRVRLSVSERAAAWRDAARLAAEAATAIRHASGQDSDAAADIVNAAGDVLAVTARAIEGRHSGPLTDAATTFDRAARDLRKGSISRPSPTNSPGAGLRATARLLALAGPARRDETTQVLALLTAIAGVAEALADLRRSQRRSAHAEAAARTSDALRASMGSLSSRGTATESTVPGSAHLSTDSWPNVSVLSEQPESDVHGDTTRSDPRHRLADRSGRSAAGAAAGASHAGPAPGRGSAAHPTPRRSSGPRRAR
jgi:hypothetical protein